jgi:glycosyltransferase involved in cell wall biosynthesis
VSETPRIAVVVPFLNEEEHLGRLLWSLERHTQRPERLVLVDDGSTDESAAIAARAAVAHDWVSAVRLPKRPPTTDRLAVAAEYAAFGEGLAWAGEFDAVGKLDADLELPADFLATLGNELRRDPRLGIVGAYLSVMGKHGRPKRERHPAYHVRGATKFYRRECLDQLQPLEPILGWDTIDEASARMRGWSTRSVAIPSGDPLHLRPTGSVDGVVRGYSRWGRCGYAAGYHPLWVALGALKRARQKPWLIGAAAYLGGWLQARWRGVPCADPEVRRYVRGEQIQGMRGALMPGGLR